MRQSRIPRLAYKIFKWFCNENLFDELEGDLEESFFQNEKEYGIRKARIKYWKEVISLFRPSVFYKISLRQSFRSGLYVSYLNSSFRSLAKNRLFTSINILGLAMSLAIGMIAISFVLEIRRFDSFHVNGDYIYRVNNTRKAIDDSGQAYATTSLLTADLLADEESIMEIVPIFNGFNGDISKEDKLYDIKGLYVGEEFLSVFTFPLLHGNPSTALTEPYSVVISEDLAQRLFSKTEVLGEFLERRGEQYLVTGVAKKIPSESHIKFDAIASLSTLESKPKYDYLWKWGTMWSSYVYVVIENESSLINVRRLLQNHSLNENEKVDRFEIMMDLESLASIFPGDGKYNQLSTIVPKKNVDRIVVLALIVLISAGFNYTNLSIARSIKRAKEVGIRKVIGATRGQLMRQFVLEAIIISIISMFVAYGFFLIIKPYFLTMDPYISRTTTLDLPKSVFVYFLGLSILVGSIAGIFPAIVMSRFKPSVILKGLFSVGNTRRFGGRELMTGLQFTFSMTLAILMVISYQQYQHALNFDLGFSTKNVLNVELQQNDPELLKTAFLSLSEVESVAASSSIPSTGSLNSDYARLLNSPDSFVSYSLNVDIDYLETMNHELVLGSNFTNGLAEHQLIVNEQFVKKFGLGKAEEAIGQRVSFYNGEKIIVGVVKDFHYGTIFNNLDAFAFLSDDDQRSNYLNLKLAGGDIIKTLDKIESTWSEIDTRHDFKSSFYSDNIGSAYTQFSSFLKIFGLLAIVAISISILGLLGMAVFTTESRIKELTIRKVLGAAFAQLMLLLSKNFVLIFCFSVLISIPTSVYIFENSINKYVKYGMEVGGLEIFICIISILLIGLITIGSQMIKAAYTNPAEQLRDD